MEIIIVIFLVIMVFFVGIKLIHDNEKINGAESLNKAKEAYSKIKSEIVIPNNAAIVHYNGGDANLLRSYTYAWIENDNLCFFPTSSPESDIPSNIERIQLYKIPIEKIEYFKTNGEVFRETKISGGGGGGSSIGGAVAGAVIAGGAGAIIGSRKKVEPIKSELVTHDSRQTFINYFIDNRRHQVYFNYNNFDVFNKLIPEKSFEIVNTVRTNKVLNKALNGSMPENITAKIKELAKLHDEGILTDEEFSEKKKELLAQI